MGNLSFINSKLGVNTMGNIVIKNKLKEFICIFEIIETLSPETDITFSPEGIYIKAIHPSNHCLVMLKIDKGMFEEYNIENEETYTLNIELLTKILTKNKGELKLKIDDGKLRIVGSNKNFALKYFVSEPNSRERPNIVTTSKWKVSSNNFFGHVTDLAEFGTNCKITANDVLSLHISSDLVEGEVEVQAEKIESEDCYSFYDLSYIEMIKKSGDIFKNLRLGFGKDNPLLIKGDVEHIDFEFILAARAE